MTTPDPRPLVTALRRVPASELYAYTVALVETRDRKTGPWRDVYATFAALVAEVCAELGDVERIFDLPAVEPPSRPGVRNRTVELPDTATSLDGRAEPDVELDDPDA